MLKILPVYSLTILFCVDAYFSKFLPRGARALPPKRWSFRDEYSDYYWPEKEQIHRYKHSLKRSLPRAEACLPNPRTAKIRKDGDSAARTSPQKIARKMSGQSSYKCRSNRRAQSLHARHDDTKYDLTPYSSEYDYHDRDSGRTVAMRKGREKYNRKQRCNCRKKKHVICADVDYFHEVLMEFERLMRKFLLDREQKEDGGIEDDIEKLKDGIEDRKLRKIHPHMVEDTKRTITKDDKNPKNEQKKPFLHV